MPHKRATRGQGPKKPTAAATRTLSEEELKAKTDQLDVILSDFDDQVKRCLSNFDREQTRLEIYIDQVFRDALSKLPLDVKNMTMREYSMKLKQEQTVKPLVAKPTKDLAEIQNFVWNSTLETVNEDENNPAAAQLPAPSTARAAKGKRGKARAPSTQTRAPRTAKAAPPPSSPRRTRSRLPITPSTVRGAKQGEILMSMAGSPVIPATVERRRALGAMLTPETKNKCAAILENTSGDELPTEERVHHIFQLITASLAQDD